MGIMGIAKNLIPVIRQGKSTPSAWVSCLFFTASKQCEGAEGKHGA